MLREFSILWSLAHTLVMFILLFESRYPKKKTMIITLATMIPLIIANSILAFNIDAEQMGTILLLTLSLPSLVVFWILAKNRDGRFFFTFCLVDTAVLEIIYITQILNFYITPNSNVFMFAVRLVIYPLIEWFISSFMTTVLSVFGRILTMTLKSYPGTEPSFLPISVCIWKWHR